MCSSRCLKIPKSNMRIVSGWKVCNLGVQDYFPLVRKEDAFIAVEKNVTGSTPKELFEDLLETADAQFEKDRAVLKDAAKDITVTPDSTFDQFNAALEDIESVKKIIKPNRCEQGLVILPFLGRFWAIVLSYVSSGHCRSLRHDLLTLDDMTCRF